MVKLKRMIRVGCIFWVIGLLWSCRQDPSSASASQTLVRVWAHQGQEAENEAMRGMAEAFNAAHPDIRVDLDFFPDYQYTEKLSIAAAGGDMPDVFDLDGPTVAQFADAGLLAPIPTLLPELPLDDFAPSIVEQGTYEGTVYALGAFDSALVLYFDREMLTQAGVVPPPPNTAWSWDHFLEACRALHTLGIQPVALHMDISADEWFTYAFSPLIWSAGGRLISPPNGTDGVLDHPLNQAALARWQGLFEKGYARRSPMRPDPFGAGETAMDWSGHWMARSHLEAKGEQLGVMPLPRTGKHVTAACGSWCWAVSSRSRHPEAAAQWLSWVLDPATGVRPIVEANGAVPARTSAYRFFPEYQQEPFATFRHLQEHHAQPRPVTPVYPVLTRHFAAALRDIARGADVEERLADSAKAVQRVIDRNQMP